jgi:hypothetical protein
MADYLTFGDIIAEVERAVKQYQSSMQPLVKATINMVYLTEILQVDNLYPLHWLLSLDDSRKSVAPVSITGISQANPGVVSSVHSLVAGDIVSIYGVSGMTEVNYRTFLVGTVVAGVSFQLLTLEGSNVNTTSYTAWTSGGTVVHRGITLSSGTETILKNGVAWLDEDRMVEITPMEVETGEKDWWTDSTGRPERFMHKKNYSSAGAETDLLLWFLGADGIYYLRYWHQRRAARLVVNGDVPQIPWKFHDALISGSITRLMENNVQVENAVIWPGLYKMQTEAIKNFNRRWWKQHESEQLGSPYLL